MEPIIAFKYEKVMVWIEREVEGKIGKWRKREIKEERRAHRQEEQEVK